MANNPKLLFVISKSTGFVTLCAMQKLVENVDLQVLVLNDKSDPRSCFDKIEKYCLSNDISYEVAEGKKCLVKAIEKHKPDMVFVCGWYWIIDSMSLAKVPKGIFGIHNSLLPKYRGHAPLVWSMLNGDEYVGASMFRIEEGMDTGKVYKQWQVKVKEKYIGSVLKDIEEAIESDFGKEIELIISDQNLGWNQEHSKASFTSKRRQEDGLVDWSKTSEIIVRQVRALSAPYPNAFMFVGKRKIDIQTAELFEHDVYGEPGQVAFVCDSYAVVCCGSNQGVKISSAKSDCGEKSISKLFSRLSSPTKNFELRGSNDLDN